MTMSSRSHWSIAAAKAELSHVVRRAQREPQVIENRGEPVAVVIAMDDYQRMAAGERARTRWREFLALSAELRAEGGFELELSPRESRPSPFERPPKRR